MKKVKRLARLSQYTYLSLIAMDHGISITGWSQVIYTDINSRVIVFFSIGTVRTYGKSHADKLSVLNEKLGQLTSALSTRFSVGVTENVFVNLNWKSSNVLSYAKAICLLNMHPSVSSIHEVYNTELKRCITGHRWYNKGLMTKSLSYLTGYYLEHNDGVDALGLCFTYLYSLRLLPSRLGPRYLRLAVET